MASPLVGTVALTQLRKNAGRKEQAMAPVWGKRTRTFCGEIQYWSSLRGNGWIHSDICPSHDEETVILTEAYRKYLHECLDEWLDHSNGTGAFWVGNREHLFED